MIVKFVNKSSNLIPFRKSQILFECANLFLTHPDLKWKKKVIDLLEQSTILFDSEKQL